MWLKSKYVNEQVYFILKLIVTSKFSMMNFDFYDEYFLGHSKTFSGSIEFKLGSIIQMKC